MGHAGWEGKSNSVTLVRYIGHGDFETQRASCTLLLAK